MNLITRAQLGMIYTQPRFSYRELSDIKSEKKMTKYTSILIMYLILSYRFMSTALENL